jgi:hypothetical protein
MTPDTAARHTATSGAIGVQRRAGGQGSAGGATACVLTTDAPYPGQVRDAGLYHKESPAPALQGTDTGVQPPSLVSVAAPA